MADLGDKKDVARVEDQGELVTSPSLPDAQDLADYEAARQKLMPILSLSTPAARYKS